MEKFAHVLFLGNWNDMNNRCVRHMLLPHFLPLTFGKISPALVAWRLCQYKTLESILSLAASEWVRSWRASAGNFWRPSPLQVKEVKCKVVTKKQKYAYCMLCKHKFRAGERQGLGEDMRYTV